MTDANTRYVRIIETEILQDSVADGNYDFTVDPSGPRNNILEYFYFVNAAGDQVDPTAGTVVITVSSGANIFQNLTDNQFNAVNARDATRTKPNGIGRAETVRITLSGITGPIGDVATGFRALFSQFAG